MALTLKEKLLDLIGGDKEDAIGVRFGVTMA